MAKTPSATMQSQPPSFTVWLPIRRLSEIEYSGTSTSPESSRVRSAATAAPAFQEATSSQSMMP